MDIFSQRSSSKPSFCAIDSNHFCHITNRAAKEKSWLKKMDHARRCPKFFVGYHLLQKLHNSSIRAVQFCLITNRKNGHFSKWPFLLAIFILEAIIFLKKLHKHHAAWMLSAHFCIHVRCCVIPTQPIIDVQKLLCRQFASFLTPKMRAKVPKNDARFRAKMHLESELWFFSRHFCRVINADGII